MTVRDLIWVRVAQYLKQRRENEYRESVYRSRSENVKAVYLAICDCRALLLDSDQFLRIAAVRDSGVRKLENFDIEKLPSCREEALRETERRAKLTPEERAEEDYKKFMAGETIRRS